MGHAVNGMEHHDSITEKHTLRKRDEEAYFARRDRELIAKLRQAEDETQRRNIRELVYLRCPDCGAKLRRATHYGVTIEECPASHGLWMTETEMHALARRERNSWIARYFYRPKPVVR